MGPSGSGKTSFLRALAGLWNTGKGNIIFNVEDTIFSRSQDTMKADEEQRRSRNNRAAGVFFLPQKPYMVLGTLQQQLLYPTWSEEMDPTSNDSSGTFQ